MAGKRQVPRKRTARVGRVAGPKPRSAAASPRAAAPSAGPAKARPTIPVHALGDDRLHLALAQPGRLRQGYLKTLCGLQAVTALSPFALADPAARRCRVCFAKVDEEGRFPG